LGGLRNELYQILLVCHVVLDQLSQSTYRLILLWLLSTFALSLLILVQSVLAGIPVNEGRLYRVANALNAVRLYLSMPPWS
jgi:uncharacterized Tic20 family protein